ncbi:hypothetical protein [Cecembia rubra]|uniref:hypothetical protein n=1 Tax=Cecembia rubra TaxID=1485585 RepID=UPI0014736D72|nr:hypothetical protein [Cecembia rubra]
MEKLYNFYFYLLMPLILVNQFIYQMVYIPSWVTALALVLGAVLFFAQSLKMRKKTKM